MLKLNNNNGQMNSRFCREFNIEEVRVFTPTPGPNRLCEITWIGGAKNKFILDPDYYKKYESRGTSCEATECSASYASCSLTKPSSSVPLPKEKSSRLDLFTCKCCHSHEELVNNVCSYCGAKYMEVI
jgi:hypothetical protein